MGIQKLGPKDQVLIQTLLDGEVFKDVDCTKIKTKHKDGGEIAIMCGDGDQIVDKIIHRLLSTLNEDIILKNTEILVKKIIRENKKCKGDTKKLTHELSKALADKSINRIKKFGITQRLHVLTANGGPILIPRKSPLNSSEHHERNFLMKQIKDAIQIKGIKSVVLYTHAPCGAAQLAGLHIAQQIQLLLDAETELKEKFPDITVTRYFHIDNGERKKTYFVSREKWDKYIENREHVRDGALESVGIQNVGLSIESAGYLPVLFLAKKVKFILK